MLQMGCRRVTSSYPQKSLPHLWVTSPHVPCHAYLSCKAAATPATSPAKILTSAIAKSSTRRCLALYMSCAIMLTALNLFSFTSEEREHLRLDVFVKSRYVIQSYYIILGRKLHDGQRHSSVPVSSEAKTSSRKHPYYLNGRLLFLIFAQLWLAASFFLRNIMLDRFVFRWTKSSNSSELVSALLPFQIVVDDPLIAICVKHSSETNLNNVSFHYIFLDGV